MSSPEPVSGQGCAGGKSDTLPERPVLTSIEVAFPRYSDRRKIHSPPIGFIFSIFVILIACLAVTLDQSIPVTLNNGIRKAAFRFRQPCDCVSHRHIDPDKYIPFPPVLQNINVSSRYTSPGVYLPASAFIPTTHTSVNNPPSSLMDKNQYEGCFALAGHAGDVMVLFNSRSVSQISHFTVDNSQVNGIVHPIFSPRNFVVWGLVEGDRLPAVVADYLESLPSGYMPHQVWERAMYIPIANFCFDPTVNITQTFPIEPRLFRSKIAFSVIFFQITSNWGGSHTCIGKLRIHGY
jgi:hypothetical protein